MSKAMQSASTRKEMIMRRAAFAFALLASACTGNVMHRHDVLRSGREEPIDKQVARFVEPCSQSKFDPTCRYKSIESGSGYMLYFVEFDEQGRLYDDAQLETLFAYLRRRAHCGADLSVLTFVHGWRHNASHGDDNVDLFRGMLSSAALAERSTSSTRGIEALATAADCPTAGDARGREVVGIYVGWRGRSLNGQWLLPIGIGHVWEWLSVWDRKSAAENVAVGSVRELFSRLRAFQALQNRASDGCPDRARYFECARVRLAVIGHSFGALMVYNAMAGSLIESLAQSYRDGAGDEMDCDRTDRNNRQVNRQSIVRATGLGGPGSASIVGSFADLVVLLNPAIEGARFEALHQALLRRNQRSQRFCPNQKPVMVVLTADNDHATGIFLPFIHGWLSTFEHDAPFTRSGEEALMEARSLEEKEARESSLGHITRFQTHELRSVRDEASRDPAFAKAMTDYCSSEPLDAVDRSLKACRCDGLQMPPRGTRVASSPAPVPNTLRIQDQLTEQINTAEMLTSTLEPRLRELTRGDSRRLLYSHDGWRRVFCGGVVLAQNRIGDPVREVIAEEANPSRRSTASTLPNARQTGGLNPIWVVKSHDRRVMSDHGIPRSTRLLSLFHALYQELDVAEFNPKGFGELREDAKRELANTLDHSRSTP